MSLFDEHKAERRERILDAGMKILEASPAFFRAVMQMFLTSPETSDARRRVELGFVLIMEATLRAAKDAGQLAEWADPTIVARLMYMQSCAGFMAWSLGEVDFATFRAMTLSGHAHILAGIARGPFAAEVEAALKHLITPLRHLIAQEEARHVATRR